jgi:two-component system LytT family response regulator
MTAPGRPPALRVVVADDEPLARKRIRSLLARHADVEIVAEHANGPDTVAGVQAVRPDVLFLDVQMPGMTGVEVMRALGARAVPAVVFVTAYDAHAVQAFEHHALDYVLKPVDADRFERALARVRERLAERSATALTESVLRLLAQGAGVAPTPGASAAAPAAPTTTSSYPSRILLRSTDRLSFVDVAALDWIEAEGDYVRLHAGKASHLHRSTLSALEAQLDPAEFVRIHRSTIVRLARIRELQPYFHGEYVVVLHDGTKVKLSRSYRDRLQAALGQPL